MRKLRFLALIPFLALSACNPNEPVRIINTTSYPNLPDIVLPPDLNLEEVRFDIPRDLSQQIIKSTPACQAVAPEARDKAFWLRCGQYKAITNTNIYVGLSREDFEKLRRNLDKLKTREQQYRYRLDLVNQQRREWRKANTDATKAATVAQ